MKRSTTKTIAFGTFALIVALGANRQAAAQDAKGPYSSMAPLDQYLMADRTAEIALARSAAPEAISRDAEVMVLGRQGYETAVKGKNGFVCVVERSWTAGIDDPDFWNPRLRGAICFNPPAVDPSFQSLLRRQSWFWRASPKLRCLTVSRTHSTRRIAASGDWCDGLHAVKGAVLRRSRRALASALDVFCFANGRSKLGRRVARFPDSGNQRPRGPMTIFLIPVGKWSDGTADRN